MSNYNFNKFLTNIQNKTLLIYDIIKVNDSKKAHIKIHIYIYH